jgi:hypothetical protein
MPERESWLFRVQLPAGVGNPGRFMARLLRVWGVKCVAILDSPDGEASDPNERTVDR